ncbi:spermidine/putrescine transport system permease protein [Rhodoligotrophos appendicifer]|uniref:ABC transporter permease n=1 Tax=Rhodoligotrophos appendicifer TaxID=987056 RepID=UPI001186108C|nr:ABC transporter permease [Rhodoligotrophos appendicifer]
MTSEAPSSTPWDAATAAPRRRSGFGGIFYRSETLRGYALVLPIVLAVGIFLSIALVNTILTSLWVQDYMEIRPDWTIAQYVTALTHSGYRMLFIRSLWISGLTTLLCVIIAYPIAYFVAFYGGRRKMIWIILLTVPFWTSYLLRVFAWKVILGYNGVINSGLMSLGLIDQPIEILLYNPVAIVITLTHAWLPFAILPIYVSLDKIDRSYVEAASDLGDGAVARFLRVVLPLSLPGVVAASLMIFIPTVGDYVTPVMVGGPDGMMIGNAIAANFGKVSNWPLGSALSLTSMVIVTLVSVGYMTLGRRLSERVA